MLADLVEDGFSEAQFFQVAQELVDTVYGVAQNTQVEPILRALAVSVFKGCFDTLEMVLEDHKSAVKRFAEQTVNAWMPLFEDVMSAQLPARDAQEDLFDGMVALKLQVVKVNFNRARPGFLMMLRLILGANESSNNVSFDTCTTKQGFVLHHLGATVHLTASIPVQLY